MSRAGASQVVPVVKNSLASAGDIRDLGFYPWVGKVPWRKKQQPTPVIMPEKSHGQRNGQTKTMVSRNSRTWWSIHILLHNFNTNIKNQEKNSYTAVSSNLDLFGFCQLGSQRVRHNWATNTQKNKNISLLCSLVLRQHSNGKCS